MPSRHSILLILPAVAVILAAGCARENDPSAVARAFLDAWKSGDRAAAAECVHPDGLTPYTVSLEADEIEIRSYELGRAEIVGDKAWVPYTALDATIDGKKAPLPACVLLRRHEGRWRVVAGAVPPPESLSAPAPAAPPAP